MKVNSMSTPLGVDKISAFSWRMESKEKGAKQTAYRILVSKKEDLSNLVWDTGQVKSDQSVGIAYRGENLEPETRYFWQVVVWDQEGRTHSSTSWFETGLMGTGPDVWENAQWIGSPLEGVNTAVLHTYCVAADVTIEPGNKAGFVIQARNKDNYVLVEFDMDQRSVNVVEYSDNAWNGDPPYRKLLKAARIPEQAAGNTFHAEIRGDKNRKLSVYIGHTLVFSEEGILPEDPGNQPRKSGLMSIGFKQENSKAVYRNLVVENTANGVKYQQEDFKTAYGVLSALGEAGNGKLMVKNRFELVCPVPAVNVKKEFNVEKAVKSARLYACARGFYNAYINGEKIGADFYNPGFTDYRRRIQYQTYDVTDGIRPGTNVIGATVEKGYYSGFCGYSGAQIYGTENSFIGKLVIAYTDGTAETVVTGPSWKFTGKGPVLDSDYLDGESYDARLELDWFAREGWSPCGVKAWPFPPKPTNGSLSGVPFELSAQEGPGAKVMQELDGRSIGEHPAGHFVYDFGQNMVGSIRLTVKGKAGMSVKIRYGEMVNKNNEVYIKNLRTAANTDTYTLKGAAEGETFVPSFTSHGFRYAEITGNGFELKKEDLEIVALKGLVIHHLEQVTGSFECSNQNINRLQQNIQWGQRGNYLLVLTDCPQRNERMGWTGDAQVFAKTSAYNMDVAAFTKKWLQDVIDGQLMYHKNGAVPDTAPLGGDNRPDGCAGWGDAAVIVPWEMYRAYGDPSILEECYEMMAGWIDYQSREDRQNYGVRTVDGKQVPDQSDLAAAPFLQTQQRRGDHLAFDCSTPYILSATAYAAHVADLMAQIAQILGKEKDAQKYQKRFEDIKKAFNEAWVQEDGTLAYWGEMSERTPQGELCRSIDGSITRTAYYSDAGGSLHHPSQTAYALAVDFGLIPPEKMAGAAKGFQKSVDRQGGHLTVGFLGISHLAPALTKAGLSETAFKLLEQQGNPGWLYSVINGATTIWERWDSYITESDTFGDVSMNSFNHYAYGAVGEWMFDTILGIRPETAGYKTFILAPTLGGELTYARGYHDSPYGRIRSEWRLDGGDLLYQCTVPANTTATLYLPTTEKAQETGFIGIQNGRSVYHLESGTYQFKVKAGAGINNNKE